MNMEDIQTKLQEIRYVARKDPEKASRLEYTLLMAFVKSIEQPDDKKVHSTQQLLIIRQKAKEIMHVFDIDFPRWMA